MDIDLGEGWEKKALIVVAVVVFMLVAYAYNPFQAKTTETTANQTTPTSNVPVTQTPVATNNSTNTTNSTNISVNHFLVSAAQAKNIALSQNPGYTASEPIQGTIVMNQTTIAVWIVPLSKFGQPARTVYVDVNTGKVVNTT
jgi:hypothetical protein